LKIPKNIKCECGRKIKDHPLMKQGTLVWYCPYLPKGNFKISTKIFNYKILIKGERVD
jgi:hypothetical protein